MPMVGQCIPPPPSACKRPRDILTCHGLVRGMVCVAVATCSLSCLRVHVCGLVQRLERENCQWNANAI
jgi:hypothetical protein